VGTWGVNLYGSDTARDLRSDLQRIVRAPWDGDEIRAWAEVKYPALADAGDADHTDLILVLADQFWSFGIEHDESTVHALEIVADGDDLERKRALGMSDRDLARRAKVLDELAAKWRRPSDKPKHRRVLSRPEAFLFEVGDCFVYPTSSGKPRNPYVSARLEESFYGRHPWEQNGWGAGIVLARSHHYGVFARYVAAFVAPTGTRKPTLEETLDAPLRCFDDIRFVPTEDGRFRDTVTSRPSVFVVTASRNHLARMRVEVVGRAAVDDELVGAEFDPDVSPIARFGVQDLARHATVADTSRHGSIRAFLRTA